MTPFAPGALCDTHAHLQDPQFEADREAVLARAEQAGVCAVVCVGYDLDSSRRAVELAASYPALYAAVGIHPNSAGQATTADWDQVRQLAGRPKVVAIGETGLDSFRDATPAPIQECWFERHLALADERGLPVIVHNRDANERVRALLRGWLQLRRRSSPPGVMHCFAGDEATLAECLSLGFRISFAGPVTFKNADRLRALAAEVPADRLVVETDSPYLSPHPYRGQRNEPSRVQLTAQRLAELRQTPYALLAEQTTRNAAELFGLDLSRYLGAETP
jgi:TatD DNase family protein